MNNNRQLTTIGDSEKISFSQGLYATFKQIKDSIKEFTKADLSEYTLSASLPKTYSAYLYQTGTTAPTTYDLSEVASAPIKDDFGGVWSYSAVGKYRYTKTGAFSSVSKVFITINENAANQAADIGAKAKWIDANTIELQVFRIDTFDTEVSASTITPVDGKLWMQGIKIEVYP